MRTLYAINKLKLLLGFVGPEWEQSTGVSRRRNPFVMPSKLLHESVAQLDSVLNGWFDSVPVQREL